MGQAHAPEICQQGLIELFSIGIKTGRPTMWPFIEPLDSSPLDVATGVLVTQSG